MLLECVFVGEKASPLVAQQKAERGQDEKQAEEQKAVKSQTRAGVFKRGSLDRDSQASNRTMSIIHLFSPPQGIPPPHANLTKPTLNHQEMQCREIQPGDTGSSIPVLTSNTILWQKGKRKNY